MDDLLNKFKSLSIYKTIKLLELEELTPKLPEFELFPKVKICTLGREYVFFKKNFVKEKENELEHLIHYSSKDKESLLAKISLNECKSLIQQEVKEGLDIFLVIEKILNDLFGKVKKLVSKECINLTKLIGKEKTAILLCELGSLKRLTEIPAKNLKGIGYVNNFIFQQPSYLTGVKKNLRKLCNEVSFAAKKDFYNFEYEKKKIKNKNSLKNEKLIEKEKLIKKEKLIQKRGGKKLKKIRNKVLINRLIKEELKNKKKELFSSTSSDSEI